MPLIRHTYPTPLGDMIALLSGDGLCLLEFSAGTRGLDTEIAQVEAARGGPAPPGASTLSARLGVQLAAYFGGRSRRFELPLDLVGTPFQLEAWRALCVIPYGQTRSYAEQARQIGRPSAVRAVAAADGRNKVCVVVPCHRVIGSDGSLIGYGGGVERKRRLLALERSGVPPAAPRNRGAAAPRGFGARGARPQLSSAPAAPHRRVPMRSRRKTMEELLAGRHVVVTSGTGAQGTAVVERLLQAGAHCHVPSRSQTASASATHERLHHRAGVDLTDAAAVDAFYAGVPQLWASVHLAGGFAMAPIAATTRADFLHLIELNALTTLLCCSAAVRALRRGGAGGRIVNVSARPGVEPRRGAGMATYAASKAAVTALTLALAEELKDEHILVNAIAPSTLDTAANRRAMPGADPSAWLAPQAAAEAVLQLIAPANAEVSGAVLPLYARV